jgi:hypothetical protein
MTEEKKEPRLPVDVKRAMDHALLAVKRAWITEVTDFEGWGGFDVGPEPLMIHDLDGKMLFYEFEVEEGNKAVGAIKASASKMIGSVVPTIEFGPRSWDPKEATRKAKSQVRERFPRAEIIETELVCYSFPKIGVRVYVEDPDLGSRSLIFDVGDLSLVEQFGADGLEGSAAWSFYQEIAEPHAGEKEQLFELAERELDQALSESPDVLRRTFEEGELPEVKSILIPPPPIEIPATESRTLQCSPRCKSAEWLALYSQKTSVYCAVATGQMILDYYRYYYSQDEIAAAMGTGAGGTSNSGQVNGYQKLSNYCLDATLDGTASWSEAKTEIDANRPLKSGIPKHARACVGWMRQNITKVGQKPKRWLKIYDPWPWNADICKGGKIVWEDWDAITHTNFIYVRHRATPCK